MKRFSSCLLSALLIAAGSAGAFDFEGERSAILERLTSIEKNDAGRSASERLNEFIEIYFDQTMLEFPEFATFIGEPEGNDRWSSSALQAIERREIDTVRAFEFMKSLDRSELTGQDRLNYDLLLDAFEIEIAGHRFSGEYLAISQLGGVQQDAAQMISMMPANNMDQYNDILSRIESIPTLVDETIDLLKAGLEAGVTPPQITLRDVPQQIKNQLVDDPMQSPLLAAFTRMPDSIPVRDRKRLRKRAEKAFTAKVRPAFHSLHDYLVEEYLPGARETIAMSDLPEGKDWYALRVRQMTTTDLTPQEIHDIGLSEVARIRAKMDDVIKSTGFEGTFADFTEFLRTDPQFYFDSPEELLGSYRDIAKRADPELVKLFGKLPRLPYGVIAVPAYAEKSQTTAYYMPGSLEAGRPGYFYANTYDLKTRPKWEMEALTLHEAVPGHHFQLALQQEHDLAWFRRFGGYTAFIEGWGLYSESLGKEMGFYTDPYSEFGQLTYEIWRAIRLVVDTGMHSLGWSRQQAIDYFKENTGKSEHDIVVEVDRYIVWPGQALAYKIGELKLKELRALAEQELGDEMDIRGFHDTVLSLGSVPLSVLETRVREWIEETRAGASIAKN